MTLLISANGFRRVVQRPGRFTLSAAPNNEVSKLAWKQTHDLKSFSSTADGAIRVGECELSPARTQGRITSKGKTITWDLKLQPGHDAPFNLVPPALEPHGPCVKNTAITVAEDLRFDGTVINIDGEKGLSGKTPPECKLT